MLNLRELAKKLIQFKIGDGSKSFLWFDNWHLDGCLIDKYGLRVFYDAASHKEAKVSSIIQNGDWFWQRMALWPFKADYQNWRLGMLIYPCGILKRVLILVLILGRF